MTTLAEHLKKYQPKNFIGKEIEEKKMVMFMWYKNIRYINSALGNSRTNNFFHKFRKACGFYDAKHK